MKYFKFISLLFIFSIYQSIHAQNTILFEEHFDNNSKGWLVGEDQWAKRKIQKGRYYMACKGYLLPNSGTSWAVVPGLTLPSDNFKIQCRTYWIGNKNNNGYFHSYGLQVGNYRFELYANGDRRLMFWDGKKDNVVVDYSGAKSSIFDRGKGIVDITIEIRNGLALFYGNDQLLLEKKIGSASGQLQLRTSHSEIVEFDDLIVTKFSLPEYNFTDTVTVYDIETGKPTVWMRNNLNTEHFRNGDKITEAKTDREWKEAADMGKPAWCYYNNYDDGANSPGKLYNWWAVTDNRGLAPKGWHITHEADWVAVKSYKIKELNFTSGIRTARGYFDGSTTKYWTTNPTVVSAIINTLKLNVYLNLLTEEKGNGYFVRCVKDEIAETNSSPAVARRIATEDNFCKVLDSIFLSVISRKDYLMGSLRKDLGNAGKEFWSMAQLSSSGIATFTIDKYGSRTFKEEISTGQSDNIRQLYDVFLLQFKKCYKNVVSHNEGTILRSTYGEDSGEKFITLRADLSNPSKSSLIITVDW